MAGSNPALIVRVAATIEELRANLKEGVSQIETTSAAMGKLAASFSGDKLVQQAMNVTAAVDAIGGVSKLTEAEMARVNSTMERALEKYRVLGKEAPAGMQALADATKGATAAGESWSTWLGKANTLLGAFGVAVSVGAAVQFGKALLDDAGALVDLNAKTGVSIEQLQRFTFVGKQANVSVDDFAQASFKLGIALEGGDKSVVKAVERLKLSYDDLRTKSPDEQFNLTVRALEKVGSETERNRLGVDLFGKAFATIAPAVAAGYTDMATQAAVSSDAQIKAIDNASDAWDRWYATQKTHLTSALGNWALAQEQLGKLTEEQLRLYHTYTAAANFTKAQEYLLELARLRAKQVDIALPNDAKAVTLTKEQQDAAEKLAAAMVELNAAGVGWQGTLAGISEDTVEAIKWYLDAGVSQGALATAYGLTAVQVKAVATAQKEYGDMLKAVQQIEADKNTAAETGLLGLSASQQAASQRRFDAESVAISRIQAAQAVLHDAEMRASLDTATYQINKIWEKADAEIKAFTGTEAQAKTHADLMYTIASYEAKAITDVMNSAADAMAAKTQALLTAMAGTWAQYQAALDAANPNSVGTRVFDLGPGTRTGGTGRYVNGVDTWGAQTMGRASGGPVSAGQPYLVGERGPELFVPERSGTIVSGSGGGTTVSNTFYLVDTAEDLARRVADLIMQSVNHGSQRSA